MSYFEEQDENIWLHVYLFIKVYLIVIEMKIMKFFKLWEKKTKAKTRNIQDMEKRNI